MKKSIKDLQVKQVKNTKTIKGGDDNGGRVKFGGRGFEWGDTMNGGSL